MRGAAMRKAISVTVMGVMAVVVAAVLSVLTAADRSDAPADKALGTSVTVFTSDDASVVGGLEWG
jgi:hypothetical protein